MNRRIELRGRHRRSSAALVAPRAVPALAARRGSVL